jgi:hypothetical protein
VLTFASKHHKTQRVLWCRRRRESAENHVFQPTILQKYPRKLCSLFLQSDTSTIENVGYKYSVLMPGANPAPRRKRRSKPNITLFGVAIVPRKTLFYVVDGTRERK